MPAGSNDRVTPSREGTKPRELSRGEDTTVKYTIIEGLAAMRRLRVPTRDAERG
jgi:hypothetical protein